MNAYWRPLLAFLPDVAACAVAWLGAYWLRFTPEVPDHHLQQALMTLLWVVPVHAASEDRDVRSELARWVPEYGSG